MLDNVNETIMYLDMCDLDQIAESGQCFRWMPVREGGYLVHDGADQAYIKQIGTVLLVRYAGNTLVKWFRYLDAGTDYRNILESIPDDDKYLRAAADRGRGLRILRADLWETMISFIISQNNNIPRIKASISALCRKLGKPRRSLLGKVGKDLGKDFYFTFPAPADMADLDALQGLGLGYRDKYLAELARDVMFGRFRPDKLQDMSTDEARRYLKSVRGIGDKVANCILLFGLSRHDAFPVDTWMKKIIDREYGGKFPLERYPKTAGIMQQYMFYAERMGDNNVSGAAGH